MREYEPRPGDDSINYVRQIKDLIKAGLSERQIILFQIWRNNYKLDYKIRVEQLNLAQWLKESGKIDDDKLTEGSTITINMATKEHDQPSPEQPQTPSGQETPPVAIEDQIAALIREGFSREQVNRTIHVRKHQFEPKYSELTPEASRLEFARWLYQNGKIQV